jgi:hypothetical protein
MHGFGYQHAVVNLAQQRRKRMTLAAFDGLESQKRREVKDKADDITRKAKDSI